VRSAARLVDTLKIAAALGPVLGYRVFKPVGVPQPHEVRHGPHGEDQLRLLLAAGCGSGPRYLQVAVGKV